MSDSQWVGGRKADQPVQSFGHEDNIEISRIYPLKGNRENQSKSGK